jgi:hypothetical protein
MRDWGGVVNLKGQAFERTAPEEAAGWPSSLKNRWLCGYTTSLAGRQGA